MEPDADDSVRLARDGLGDLPRITYSDGTPRFGGAQDVGRNAVMGGWDGRSRWMGRKELPSRRICTDRV